MVHYLIMKQPILLEIEVEVSDGSLGTISTISIGVLNVNEPPMVNSTEFSINDDVTDGASVGNLNATDPEEDPLNYEIISGNDLGIFAISADGELVVSDASSIDVSTNSSFSLVVTVSDAEFTTEATIDIDLRRVTGLESTSMAVFPNPATTVIKVSNLSTNAVIRVFDLLGNQIQLPVDKNGSDIQIDLASANAGIYLLEISEKSKVEILKFVVE